MIDFPIYQNIHELELTQLSYEYFLTFSRERERERERERYFALQLCVLTGPKTKS